LLTQQPSEILADKEKRDALVNRIQFGGDEVVKAKDGAGSATLSMAQGTYHRLVLYIPYKWCNA
jgi:malate/lactate dehydrogenase